jgi:hypothetical protein
MQCATFEVEEYTVHYYARDDAMTVMLQEAKHRGRPLYGPYSVQKDQPHSSVGQYHVHVYRKGNELFGLNFDGSAHDQSHGVTIPIKFR